MKSEPIILRPTCQSVCDVEVNPIVSVPESPLVPSSLLLYSTNIHQTPSTITHQLYTMATSEEKIKIASKFLKAAPPGPN
jgi:hypothetical protein